ncbi:MAG: thermonuclease family protein [Planctomycetota bacterium]
MVSVGILLGIWLREVIRTPFSETTVHELEDWPRAGISSPESTDLMLEGTVNHVYDGDTLIVAIDGMSQPWSPIAVRIAGIDAPELSDLRPEIQSLSIRARDRLHQLATGRVSLHYVKRDKFFRLIADVRVGDTSVAKTLVAEGLAKRYDGQGPRPWSPDNP